VHEAKDTVGGACKTEYPFSNAPDLGTSTGNAPYTCKCVGLSQQSVALNALLLYFAGAYLLGVMPPELLKVPEC